MATAVPISLSIEPAGAPPSRPLAAVIDRWIYVFMAGLLIVITLIGFIPDSLDKIAMVRSGARPPLPAMMHVHAVLMAAFMLLLLAQTTLAATGRIGPHMRLGVAAMLLVPALVIVGFILADQMYLQTYHAWQAAGSAAQGELAGTLARKENILLLQIRMMLLFPLFLGIGLAARATDAGLHKRMMILGTAVVLPPSLNRMAWLPSTFPASMVATELYMLAIIAPMVAWDVARNRSIHRAYWIWLAITLPAALVLHLLWNTPWWHAAARRLLVGAGL